MLRRSARHGVGKAYSNSQAPIPVTPYEPISKQARHSVPFLDGQDDIPRSDDEDGAPPPISNTHAQPSLGSGSEPANESNLLAPEQFSVASLTQQAPSSSYPVNELLDPFPLGNTATSDQPPTPASRSPTLDYQSSASPTGGLSSEQTPLTTHGDSGGSNCPYQSAPMSSRNFLASTAPLASTDPVTSIGIPPVISSEPARILDNHGTLAFQLSQTVSSLPNTLANVEQRQNIRHRNRQYIEEALRYGPTKCHAHGYVVEWYARHKPQIYAPNPKGSSNLSAHADNSKKYQGSFSIVEQHLMFPAGHSMVYDIICVDPFPVGYASIQRGISFAESAIPTRLGTEGPSDALQRFMKNKLPRQRNDLIKLVSGGIISKYGLPAVAEFDDLDAYHRTSDLIQDDSFVNSEDSQEVGTYKFTHPAIALVLKLLFFKFNPKLGMIFIDRLVASDPSNTLWHNTRRDTSPEALRGMPLEAIAFACILIKHVLFNYKQVTTGDPTARFEGKEYTSHWGRFYRKLTGLPNLGELRKGLLEAIKTHYISEHPYDPNESMVESDILW
ncbi:unnamed protein product [Rhizoctonia solani]|uniref:DUF6532 domain-containing protein n=1 Tax=Rhizoctonia solani TaxID=456999 RepID=A0A8H3DUI6_9AGAM|nr:unnamed protein product [Rhizoctonia solani]